MTIYLVVPLLAIVGLLQATLVSRVAIWGVFPDLPLLLVVSWGLLRGSRQGLLWGFVAGIIVDLFAGLGENLVFRNLLLLLLTILLATVVYDLLFLFMVQILPSSLPGTGHRVEWSASLVRVIGPSAILNAFLGLLILGSMRALDRRFRRQDAGLAGL
jgi:cell shape-determining protein MreD